VEDAQDAYEACHMVDKSMDQDACYTQFGVDRSKAEEFFDSTTSSMDEDERKNEN